MTDREREQDLLHQAIHYFGENPGFLRLFEALCAKYRSYGGFHGTATIPGVTSREAEALSGFLGVSVAKGTTFRLTAAGFSKALAKTRFHGINPVDLLKALSPTHLVTNLDAEVARQDAQTQWLASRTGSGEFLSWLEQEWTRPHSMLRRLWTEAPDDDMNALRNVFILGRETDDVGKAWDALPLSAGTRDRLPVFSTRLLQDPHAFDVGTFRNRLLLRALADRCGVTVPENAEDRATVLAHFGVMPDDVSSRVLISGLSAILRNGGSHPGWEGFRQVGSPFYATAADLCQIQGISAPGRCVWVLENPAVFMAMQEKAAEHGVPTGLVCTAGQPDLTCWLVLDDLVTSGFPLRYAGDFDPEGLLMAQRMLQRYGDDCTLWHMSVLDYEYTRPSMPLSTERLSKLSGIRHEALVETAEIIRTRGMAGYQEALIDIMEPYH